VDALWGASAGTKPRLVGPSNAGDNPSREYLETTFGKLVAEQDYLSGITFHAYPFHNGGGPTLPEDLINVEKIDAGLECFSTMADVVRNYSSAGYRPKVWMGEGNAVGGPRPPTILPGLVTIYAVCRCPRTLVGKTSHETMTPFPKFL
jgi:hypothetical protein